MSKNKWKSAADFNERINWICHRCNYWFQRSQLPHRIQQFRRIGFCQSFAYAFNSCTGEIICRRCCKYKTTFRHILLTYGEFAWVIFFYQNVSQTAQTHTICTVAHEFFLCLFCADFLCLSAIHRHDLEVLNIKTDAGWFVWKQNIILLQHFYLNQTCWHTYLNRKKKIWKIKLNYLLMIYLHF